LANSRSAKKRIRQNESRRVRNRARKSAVKTEVRKYLNAVTAGDVHTARDLFATVSKKLDQTAAKGTLHRNAAARRKSRLAKRLNGLLAAKAG